MERSHDYRAQRINEIERRIRGQDTEIVCILDDAGNVLISREGYDDWVDLDDVRTSLLAGATLIHNHPGGSSLSWQDVRLLLSAGLAEIRAVTAEWRFILALPPDTGWEDVEQLVTIMREQVFVEHRDATRAGEMTYEEMNLLHWHAVWTAVAEIRGWNYRRESWTT